MFHFCFNNSNGVISDSISSAEVNNRKGRVPVPIDLETRELNSGRAVDTSTSIFQEATIN